MNHDLNNDLRFMVNLMKNWEKMGDNKNLDFFGRRDIISYNGLMGHFMGIKNEALTIEMGMGIYTRILMECTINHVIFGCVRKWAIPLK